MYHEAAKKSWQYFRGLYPLKKIFFQPQGPVWVLQKLRIMRGPQLKFYKNCGLCGSLISFTPPYRGSPPPTQQKINIRNINQLSWASNYTLTWHCLPKIVTVFLKLWQSYKKLWQSYKKIVTAFQKYCDYLPKKNKNSFPKKLWQSSKNVTQIHWCHSNSMYICRIWLFSKILT